MASAGSGAGLFCDVWGQPPSAVRGAKLRGVLALDRAGSARGSFAGEVKKAGCARRTADGGCPHTVLLAFRFFCKPVRERRSNREGLRGDSWRAIGRDGSAPAVQVPQCAPGQIISATIFADWPVEKYDQN
jgi:hypothetical protein